MGKHILLCITALAVFASAGCQSVGWRISTFELDVTIPVPFPVPYMIEDNTNELQAPYRISETTESETGTAGIIKPIEPVWIGTEGIESTVILDAMDYSLVD